MFTESSRQREPVVMRALYLAVDASERAMGFTITAIECAFGEASYLPKQER